VRRYDPEPRYPAVGGAVEQGCPPLPDGVLAIDGPAALPWEALLRVLPECRTFDVREHTRAWQDTDPDDPVFVHAPAGSLTDLIVSLPKLDGPIVVYGPGSASAAHDELWYADIPKRLGLEAIQRGDARNLGQQAGATGKERQLFYVDWPLEDRHRQELLPVIDRYLDLTDPTDPRSLTGDTLRATLHALAGRPFRTRPTFLPGPWGGQWLRRTIGIETDAPNLAWSYELITPESGILVDSVEVGFEWLMAEQSERVLGTAVAARFRRSFPIRFDYLDTLEGGHLSIQCHPREDYMTEVFGLPYTQLETYYVMETTPGAKVFLGLREDADVAAFAADARAALAGASFDPERYLQAQPARQHQLYLIPAGTPHASGAGNVVLEISATPYLYTLRFYDWLRANADGELRPVHVDHALANVDTKRRGAAVARELIPEPRVVRSGPGWVELELGHMPELFFAVHRLEFDGEVSDDTEGRFHVLNLVAGDEATIETENGDVHPLAYGETIVVPAAVGAYRLRGRAKAIKAFVR
jgi:mannose-6-phosphate isomerase class I